MQKTSSSAQAFPQGNTNTAHSLQKPEQKNGVLQGLEEDFQITHEDKYFLEPIPGYEEKSTLKWAGIIYRVSKAEPGEIRMGIGYYLTGPRGSRYAAVEHQEGIYFLINSKKGLKKLPFNWISDCNGQLKVIG